jgi:hypothetical protein
LKPHALKSVGVGGMNQQVDVLEPAERLAQADIALPVAVADAVAFQCSEKP